MRSAPGEESMRRRRGREVGPTPFSEGGSGDDAQRTDESGDRPGDRLAGRAVGRARRARRCARGRRAGGRVGGDLGRLVGGGRDRRAVGGGEGAVAQDLGRRVEADDLVVRVRRRGRGVQRRLEARLGRVGDGLGRAVRAWRRGSSSAVRDRHASRQRRASSRRVVRAVQRPRGDLGRAVPRDVDGVGAVGEDGDGRQRRRVGSPCRLVRWGDGGEEQRTTGSGRRSSRSARGWVGESAYRGTTGRCRRRTGRRG